MSGPLARLRPAEWLAGGAALALLLVMFLDWFTPSASAGRGSGETLELSLAVGWSAWQAFSVIDLILLLTVVAALALVVATATQPTDALSLSVAVVMTAFALVATALVAFRLVVDQPGMGIGLPDGLVGTTAWAWVGLLLCVALVYAGYRSMRDERSAIGPPPSIRVRRLEQTAR